MMPRGKVVVALLLAAAVASSRGVLGESKESKKSKATIGC
jgi:hypothetical protein